MAIRKICQLGLLSLCLLFMAISHAQAIYPIGQVLQINTHFRTIVGKPTWLLILRDEQTGQVLAYQFDIKKNDNFWIAFSTTSTYRVTVSNLKFGPYAVINNFCRLENGIITGKSMFISLTGTLTPDPKNSRCHVKKYLGTLVKPLATEKP